LAAKRIAIESNPRRHGEDAERSEEDEAIQRLPLA
jgi:hypothetical protein